jgi:hypothetical protein
MPESEWERLSNMLGRTLQYRTDNNEWVPVYLVGIYEESEYKQYIEVLPVPGTDYGDKWYQENKPAFNFFPDIIKDPQPSPIKITNLGRIRTPIISQSLED